MALLKSISPGGKKQAPMPGPNSAAYKKILAAKKSAKSGAGKGGKKKATRAGAAFSSLKSKQMLVERIKRQIWGSVLKINDAILSLALAGNCTAAKALFEFAGVYSLPASDEESAIAKPVPAPVAVQPAENAATEPVQAFFRSIGEQEPDAELDPAMASAG